MDTAEEWLNREDEAERTARIERRRWLEQRMPKVKWVTSYTGPMPKILYEEACYCFVYGQCVACIVLALAFIEQSLAGLFCRGGRKDLERSGLIKLSREALEQRWITQEDFDAIRRAWDLRKPATHFRSPGDDVRIEARAFNEGPCAIREIIDRDARVVVSTMFKLLLKVTSWSASKIPGEVRP